MQKDSDQTEEYIEHPESWMKNVIGILPSNYKAGDLPKPIGMGFIAKPNAPAKSWRIVTCNHNLKSLISEQKNNGKFCLHDGRTLGEFKYLKEESDPGNDIAVLEILTPGMLVSEISGLPITQGISSKGQPINAIRFDASDDAGGFRITRCDKARQPSYVEEYTTENIIRFTSTSVAKGYSGTPVWDINRMCVIGIVGFGLTGTSGREQDVFFARRLDYLESHPELYVEQVDKISRNHLEEIDKSYQLDMYTENLENIIDGEKKYVTPTVKKYYSVGGGANSESFTTFDEFKASLRDNLDSGRLSVLVGFAGIGKTRLLRRLASECRDEFLQNRGEFFPIHLTANSLSLAARTLRQELKGGRDSDSHLVDRAYRIHAVNANLQKLLVDEALMPDFFFKSGDCKKIILFVDALDEVPSQNRILFFDRLLELHKHQPNWLHGIVCTSRPDLKLFNGKFSNQNTVFYELQPLNSASSEELFKEHASIVEPKKINDPSLMHENTLGIPLLIILSAQVSVEDKDLKPLMNHALFMAYAEKCISRYIKTTTIPVSDAAFELDHLQKRRADDLLLDICKLAYIDLKSSGQIASSELNDGYKGYGIVVPIDQMYRLNIPGLFKFHEEEIVENQIRISWPHASIRNALAAHFLLADAEKHGTPTLLEKDIELSRRQDLLETLTWAIALCERQSNICWTAESFFEKSLLQKNAFTSESPTSGAILATVNGGIKIGPIAQKHLQEYIRTQCQGNSLYKRTSIACLMLLGGSVSKFDRPHTILVSLVAVYPWAMDECKDLILSPHTYLDFRVELCEWYGETFGKKELNLFLRSLNQNDKLLSELKIEGYNVIIDASSEDGRSEEGRSFQVEVPDYFVAENWPLILKKISDQYTTSGNAMDFFRGVLFQPPKEGFAQKFRYSIGRMFRKNS